MSKTGSTEERKKIISIHLLYEIDMLRLSHHILHGGIPLPLLSQAVANLAIEGFCLHARNLVDFFADNRPLGSKDAVARHFTAEGYRPFKGNDVKKNGLYAKINKQIVHLTYDRTDDSRLKIGPKDREQLRGLIEDEIVEFSKWLRAPYDEVWSQALALRAAGI
jgi:hypothetical protein